MKLSVMIADPAGNITAIVRTPVPKSKRAAAAEKIMDMDEYKVEQVAFETSPHKKGSLGRIEMMGGEFCGNAARSYGYLRCKETGRDACKIEVSGAPDLLDVLADEKNEKASAAMPMPEAVEHVQIGMFRLPLVISKGITHLIAKDMDPDDVFVNHMIERFGGQYDAFGVMFLRDQDLTPVVYVRQTGTKVYESSCASGTLAAAYVQTQYRPDGFHDYVFKEPGGGIEVKVAKRLGRFAATIGGKLSLEGPVHMDIPI